MKIILAAPRGFCAGVNMAIDSLDLTLQKFGAPVYVYHEIVHNQYVVQTFREKGAVFVESLEDVPEGSVLLFSAHGVSPEIRQVARQRQLTAIDATCPLVTSSLMAWASFRLAEVCTMGRSAPGITRRRGRLPVPSTS